MGCFPFRPFYAFSLGLTDEGYVPTPQFNFYAAKRFLLFGLGKDTVELAQHFLSGH
jgi:hypothetical protein